MDGILVFDEVVALEREAKRDVAQRELHPDGDATFVAIVDEGGDDVTLRLSQARPGNTPEAGVEVDSHLYAMGLEIAVLDVSRDAGITVQIESAQDFDRPGKVRLRVFRYDREVSAMPPAAARIAALRAWSASTVVQLTGDELKSAGFRDIDFALRHFESADGDPNLAAWAHMLRARFNLRLLNDLKAAYADVRMAERGFVALRDSRNTARAQFMQAEVLSEISTDATARDPSAADAARETTRLLTALSQNPSLSAFERARCVGYLGAHGFNVYEWPMAYEKFREALELYGKIGYRYGRRQVLQNLGTLSAEEGNFSLANQYFDRVMPELDQIDSLHQQNIFLFNAASIDISTGNIDRAIERLLRAREMARGSGMKQEEARVLHGLGRAYWARGDVAQAATFLAEGLKLRREINDGFGLMTSLRANGTLARETGDIATAIAMHREVESLSFSPDLQLYALLGLAQDYSAASDYERAIALCRKALSIPLGRPDFYKRAEVQLTLAAALLNQRRPTKAAESEAAGLAQEGLEAAKRRSDTLLEVAARRLIAQSLDARGKYAEAREEYERAIALIFKYRSTINNPELQAATLAHEQQTFRGYVDLLMRDVARRGPGKLLPASAAEEDALRTLEWARALDFDASRASRLDGKTQERIAELLAQMAGKRVRIAALLDRASDASRELEILELDIAQLRAEVDSLRASASSATNGQAAATVEAAWPALPKDVAQLSFSLDTTHPYLWVRDSSGIRAAMLGASSAEVTASVRKLAGSIRSGATAEVDEVLAKLSRALLPAGTLSGHAASLEVAGESAILGVPFGALSSPDERAGRLSDHRSLVMITSIFESREPPQVARPRALRFVAVASEARSKGETSAAQVFSPLHVTNAEARSIATLFRAREPESTIKLMLGAEGNGSNLKQTWHDGVDVIHFATHGLADLRQPMTSLLLLPALDMDGAPTYLTAGQVQEWRGDTDLVYLSACDTAVGHGMQDAFLRAGARGVIATLWPVEDVYASQFAADFYRRYTAGTPAPQALSETQRAWMRPAPGIRESEQAYRRMTSWAHAYYAQ